MMIVKTVMRNILSFFKKMEKWAEEDKKPQKQEEKTVPKEGRESQKTQEIQSVWGYLQLRENTQAAHLASTVGFEEWVEMQEIKRRVRELFGVEYKNDRSLYPYIKTMVDCGLLESSDIGGKRKWRKKALLLKLKQSGAKQETETEKEEEQSKSN